MRGFTNGGDKGVTEDIKDPTDGDSRQEAEPKVDKNVLDQVDSILKKKPHEPTNVQ